ncbi:MAG: hypothetical protein LBM73_00610 [Candidatus Nomurabacteria bacterium]|jgi:hypothetical protein|nr:hypothetical protein [Candidatus Nomurabacteria bacterium]
MRSIKSKITVAVSALALVLGFGAVIAPAGSANAAGCSSSVVNGTGTPLSANCSTTINATVNPMLSLSGGDTTITLDGLTPTVTTAATKQVAGTIWTIGSNDQDGYNFTVKDSATSGTGALLGQSPLATTDKIATGGGGTAQVTSLTANTWGISATGVNNTTYGAYKAVGTNTAPVTVASTTATSLAAGDKISVNYGIKVDANQKAGSYTDTITYTLTAKS